MSRKSIAPQSRRHIWIYDEDWEYIEQRFGKGTAANIGIGPAIRRMIQVYVANLRSKEQQEIDRQVLKLETFDNE